MDNSSHVRPYYAPVYAHEHAESGRVFPRISSAHFPRAHARVRNAHETSHTAS